MRQHNECGGPARGWKMRMAVIADWFGDHGGSSEVKG